MVHSEREPPMGSAMFFRSSRCPVDDERRRWLEGRTNWPSLCADSVDIYTRTPAPPPLRPEGQVLEIEVALPHPRVHGDRSTALRGLVGDPGRQVGDGHRAEVLAVAVADADLARAALLVADDDAVGNLRARALADAVADRLRATVDLDPDAGVAQRGGDLRGEVGVLGLRDGDDADLFRGEPDGEGARVVLDQEGDEALEGSEDGAVDEDRSAVAAVGTMLARVGAEWTGSTALGLLAMGVGIGTLALMILAGAGLI